MLATELLRIPETEFTSSDVDRLEAALLEHPQVDCPVRHHFGPGVYIREVSLPAGSYVIGHSHKTPQMCVLLVGTLTLIGMDGTRKTVSAPATFVGAAGRKIAYIHDDVIFQNVWATDETDPEKLEALFLDKSEGFEAAQKLLLAHDSSADHADFIDAIAAFGMDEETVSQISRDEIDLIAFPHGEYGLTVGPSPINGRGMFATRSFDPGEVIAPARIGGKRTPAGRYVNHSACPNAEMVRWGDDIELFASAPISGMRGGQNGDEITIDYRAALALSL